MKRKSRRAVILLAYFHRFCLFLEMPVFLLAFLKFGFEEPLPLALSMTVPLLLYSVYNTVGCILKWDHIYCSHQSASHQRMTPHNVRWNDMTFGDKYGISIVFFVYSLLLFIALAIFDF
ncbi:MAG: hypothetical protein E7647_07020 [Ruminococcaceae bacterium]|nr:hypothetical protein [Oscillospiraceae bacterium]